VYALEVRGSNRPFSCLPLRIFSCWCRLTSSPARVSFLQAYGGTVRSWFGGGRVRQRRKRCSITRPSTHATTWCSAD